MKIICLVPTKDRALQLEAMTGSWLFDSKVDYKILVEPQDMEGYSRYNNLLELPENNRGLSYSLAFGKQWALENNYDVVFKIDDDIEGWTSSSYKNEINKPGIDYRNNTERFQIILRDIRKPLENPNLGGISFGYRQEFWHNKRWFGVNQRFQTVYVVKTAIWQPMVYPLGQPNEDMWEDFGNFLRVIKQEYKVLRYGRYLMDTGVQTGKGGLAEFYKNRTPEQYKATIELFRKQFPWLKFRLKKNGMIEPSMNNEVIRGSKL